MAPHPCKGLLRKVVRVQGIISWSGVGPPLQHLHSAWHIVGTLNICQPFVGGGCDG